MIKFKLFQQRIKFNPPLKTSLQTKFPNNLFSLCRRFPLFVWSEWKFNAAEAESVATEL
jgi:hypothetical protein